MSLLSVQCCMKAYDMTEVRQARQVKVFEDEITRLKRLLCESVQSSEDDAARVASLEQTNKEFVAWLAVA